MLARISYRAQRRRVFAVLVRTIRAARAHSARGAPPAASGRASQRATAPVVLLKRMRFAASVGMTWTRRCPPPPPPLVCVPTPHRPSRSATFALRRTRWAAPGWCVALPPGSGRPGAGWTGEGLRSGGRAASPGAGSLGRLCGSESPGSRRAAVGHEPPEPGPTT